VRRGEEKWTRSFGWEVGSRHVAWGVIMKWDLWDGMDCNCWTEGRDLSWVVLSGALAKWRKVVMSVLLHGATRLPLCVFSWNLMFDYFWNLCGENSSFIKIRRE
jgi:hypothetical protein